MSNLASADRVIYNHTGAAMVGDRTHTLPPSAQHLLAARCAQVSASYKKHGWLHSTSQYVISLTTLSCPVLPHLPGVPSLPLLSHVT